MAGRIRSIKPEWLEDEKLSMASLEARVLSVAVLLLADDHGRGRAHPAHVGKTAFPAHDDAGELARNALCELAAIGFVALYEVRGQSYFAVKNWKKHQRVDKPSAPRVPSPDDPDAAPTNLARSQEFLARSPRIAPTSTAAPERDQPTASVESSADSQIRGDLARSQEFLATDLRSPIPITDHRSPTPAAARVGAELVEILREELGLAFDQIDDDPHDLALSLRQLASVDGIDVDRREVIRQAARATAKTKGLRSPTGMLRRMVEKYRDPEVLTRAINAAAAPPPQQVHRAARPGEYVDFDMDAYRANRPKKAST